MWSLRASSYGSPVCDSDCINNTIVCYLPTSTTFQIMDGPVRSSWKLPVRQYRRRPLSGVRTGTSMCNGPSLSHWRSYAYQEFYTCTFQVEWKKRTRCFLVAMQWATMQFIQIRLAAGLRHCAGASGGHRLLKVGAANVPRARLITPTGLHEGNLLTAKHWQGWH